MFTFKYFKYYPIINLFCNEYNLSSIYKFLPRLRYTPSTKEEYIIDKRYHYALSTYPPYTF